MSEQINQHNIVDYIIKYEDGSMDDDEIVELFQFLVDTGMAWTLQGCYGRMAKALIEAGEVVDHRRPK